MDLIRRFDNAVSYRAVKILSLEIGRRYEIMLAERVTTRYGPSVLLTINLGTSDTVRVFLPTRYSNVITDDDMATINMRHVQLHLVYKETFLQVTTSVLTTHRASSSSLAGHSYLKNNDAVARKVIRRVVHSGGCLTRARGYRRLDTVDQSINRSRTLSGDL